MSSPTEIDRVFALQQAHRWTVKTSTAHSRVARLLQLREKIAGIGSELAAALSADLGRPHQDPPFDLQLSLAAIDEAVSNLDRWMQPVAVELNAPTPGVTASLIYEAKGTVLLLGPWNFPFHLIIKPLVAMVAAGNTVIVKPSEMAPATSALTARVLREAFGEEEVAVVEGDVPVAEALLEKPFDHIFITGSPRVGRAVMAAAARHLTSVTLELGGKNPAVLDGTADLDQAARQLATGRAMNAGQTCLSTDYVLVPNDLKDEFIDRTAAVLREDFYDQDGALRLDASGRAVDRRNFDRAVGLLDDAVAKGATIRFGGGTHPDELVLEPTLVADAPPDSELMHDEIFAPVMAVVGYDDISEVFDLIHARGKPLGMCVFSSDRQFINSILGNTSSGGVSINSWSGNYFDDALPFGGVGNSGIGRYHSVHGFREFSHERAVHEVLSS